MQQVPNESDVIRPKWYRTRSMRSLGVAVRDARETRGLTQDELADLISSSRPTLSRLERGASVSAETVLEALARCGYEMVVVPRGSQVTVS
ncbi:helix-turn-helix domain-containing protein [Cellulomonas oligotrophica]|uniref:HTH cro/C1-type domain-containing protein n=2 Tax=Cellulomonas oligotrophica TaxID=931536 RepID=A0ABQ4D7Q2_9CELL|nr:helix-turn-helix transcriptional regulator [Cellulomonas oligotrophica]GIG31337.1 hypothetical protein Col01nite_04960 [Cellulomonas oligotrophica]